MGLGGPVLRPALPGRSEHRGYNGTVYRKPLATKVGAERPRLAVIDELALTTPHDPYLSMKALAAYSGLSTRTLRKFLTRTPPAQALPCYRLSGGKVLVRQSDYDRFVAQYRAQGRPGLVRAITRLNLDQLGR